MSKQYRIVMRAAALAMSLLVAGRTMAQEPIITSFQNGYLSWSNANPDFYYTVEYKPNLSETNPAWDGSYRVSQDIQSTNAIISVPVGFFYRVVGSTDPLHTSTLLPNTTLVSAGYYAATNLTAVDVDLAAGNIKTNVTIFGVEGTLSTNTGGNTYSAAVPKTGQTTSYQTGDDGDYEVGVVLPTPRFTVQADTNCVTDNLTGLVWARNANIGGAMTWSAAISYCEALDYGGQTDWRLPNAKELYSLVDLGQLGPALPLGHPFAGVEWANYWSSSTVADGTAYAWYVFTYSGAVVYVNMTRLHYVWPVRGGE